ncbi:MAG: uroporphyrinogen-III synthase [Azovibrio sp.]|uniref:uroporphyrinogen-III synthase n=1 Tax=Azovibrio sp. TaxID=1872673 RepID=UPI003C75591D
MQQGLPLAGKTIVVTRPRAQAKALGRAIAAQGGRAFYFPLLEITPVEDAAPLRAVAARLEDYRLAIFISPNAVQHALPILLAGRHWPPGLQPVAVGPGTLKALEQAGVNGCLCPRQRFDSEALLDLPELSAAALAGQQVLILRGNGGRELLGDTLANRGARVERVACYQRRGPGAGQEEFLAALRAEALHGLTLSSSEALAHLLELAGAEHKAHLERLPLFVSHARIADKARAAGLSQVVLTEPGDAGLLAGLCAYNGSRP